MKIIVKSTRCYVLYDKEEPTIQTQIDNVLTKLLRIVDPESRKQMRYALPKFGKPSVDYINYYDTLRRTFPTGLLESVKDKIGKLAPEYIYETPEPFLEPSDVPEKLTFGKEIDSETAQLTLKPHQDEAVRALVENHKGVIELATNAGKTGTAIAFIKLLFPYLRKGERIIYYVPSRTIFSQAISDFTPDFGDDIGWLGSGKFKDGKVMIILFSTVASRLKNPLSGMDKPTAKEREYQMFYDEIYPMFAAKQQHKKILDDFLSSNTPHRKNRIPIFDRLHTINNSCRSDISVEQEIDKWVDEAFKVCYTKCKSAIDNRKKTIELVNSAQVVIVDEGHHIRADGMYNALYACENAGYIAALTGSVNKKDEVLLKNLEALVGKTLAKTRNDDMILQNVSAKPEVLFYSISRPTEFYGKTVTTMGDYRYNQLYSDVVINNDYRNQKIVDITTGNYHKNNACLIIVNSLEHGEILSDMINEAGIEAQFLSGETSDDERTEQISRMERGQLMCIIATTIFDEGLSVNNIKTLIMAHSTKSFVKILQRVGRTLRFKKDDNTAYVIDFCDRTHDSLYKQYRERLKIYKDEKFKITQIND